MIPIGDPRTSNPLLSALQISAKDRIISIKENANSDSNFILTHIIKQILYEKNALCLVNFHNPIEHYQHVGKKLGYDVAEATENKQVCVIDPLSDIVDHIGCETEYFQEDKEQIVRCLYFRITSALKTLLDNTEKNVYLIIDDLSHLADLSIEVSEILTFVNYCVDLINDERISVLLNNHAASSTDQIVSNNLQYVADVHVEVSNFKTGRSQDVTGLIKIERASQNSLYQYKAFDRGIKTFHPGESIYHLYM